MPPLEPREAMEAYAQDLEDLALVLAEHAARAGVRGLYGLKEQLLNAAASATAWAEGMRIEAREIWP